MIEWLFFWTEWSKCSRHRGIWPEDRPWIDHPQWVDRAADYLVPISRALQWALDLVHPKIDYVRIDPWDTWSMDSTLSMIILPMLRQLQATNLGAPNIEDEDVPEHLRSTAADPKENEWDIDSNHFARWEWVLDEMIWTFEQLQGDVDWEDQYYSGTVDYQHVPVDAAGNEVPRGEHKYIEIRMTDKHSLVVDQAGRDAHQSRITNGLRLFGRYYQALWD